MMRPSLPAAICVLLASALPSSAGAPDRGSAGMLREGVAAYQQARLDDAETAVSAAMDMAPGWKTAAGFRAIIRWEKGERSGAWRDASRASVLRPNSAESFASRGFARFVLRDREGAARDFVRAASMDKRCVPAYLGMARLRASQGRSGEALTNLDIALKMRPKAVMARLLRAEIYESGGRSSRAAEEYGRALRASPSSLEVRMRRARARVEAGDYGPAVDDLDAVIDADPHDVEALYQRSRALFPLGEHARAFRDLSRVIAIDPAHGLAYANRGMVREALGDKRGALSDLRRALVLAPEKRAAIAPNVDRLARELGEPGASPYEYARGGGRVSKLGRLVRGVFGRKRRARADDYGYENYRGSRRRAPEPVLVARRGDRSIQRRSPASLGERDLRDSLAPDPELSRRRRISREIMRRHGYDPEARRTPPSELRASDDLRDSLAPEPVDYARRHLLSESILRRNGYATPRRSRRPAARERDYGAAVPESFPEARREPGESAVARLGRIIRAKFGPKPRGEVRARYEEPLPAYDEGYGEGAEDPYGREAARRPERDLRDSLAPLPRVRHPSEIRENPVTRFGRSIRRGIDRLNNREARGEVIFLH